MRESSLCSRIKYANLVAAKYWRLEIMKGVGLMIRVGKYRGTVTRYFFSTVIGTVDTF